MTMVTYRDVITGAAVTSASRASPGTYTVPGGKGGVLIGIEVTIFPTAETVVQSGGLIEIENDSVDYKPLEFYVGGVTVVTEGGGNIKPYLFKCHKPFPGNSVLTAYYTPDDDQSQKCMITFIWETTMTFNPARETYAKSGIGSAITQVTIASAHITISIPKLKGGVMKAIQTVVWGTLETVVNSGGKVTVRNITADPSPYSFYTNGNTVVDAGGAQVEEKMVPGNLVVPGNSDFLFDYTPQDNQSQKLSAVVIWTRSGR